MTTSVKRVCKERPKLRKLVFVIPWNLSTGTQGGKATPGRTKYENRIADWKQKIAGAADIEFELVQGSDLLDRLASTEHRAREWFWWNKPVFDPTWLRFHVDGQAEVAGERYRPDLQVDLPIGEDIAALGFPAGVADAFVAHRRAVVNACRKIHLSSGYHPDLQSPLDAVAAAGTALISTLDRVRLRADTVADLESYATAIENVQAAAADAESTSWQLRREAADASRNEQDEQPAGDAECRIETPSWLRDVQRSADAFVAWLESPPIRALRSGRYFLTGPSGAGKTHLLLDAANRALDESRPAVVLFGSAFGRGELWSSICDQLGIESVGGDVLLAAMNDAGAASSVDGRRFVLMIDALNDVADKTFWRHHLPALRAAVARHSHVALVVSCRDTFVDLVDDAAGSERRHYRVRAHPGFTGAESVAVGRFFKHYGIEAPRVPLLTPEFTIPLFLRLYCESVRDAESASHTAGHEGRVRIFESYLTRKLDDAARRFRPGASTGFQLSETVRLVRAVLDSLLDEMAATGSEFIRLVRMRQLVGAVEEAGHAGVDVVSALVDEGVLSTEPFYDDDDGQQVGVRIAFQAFADHLILARRIGTTETPLTDTTFATWLEDDASWGIYEAAAVLVPERFGVELPDLLGAVAAEPVETAWHEQDDDERHAVARERRALRTFLDTLSYRTAESVTERSIELLNRAMRHVESEALFGKLFELAAHEGNRLNAEGLHRHLAGMSLPQRDAHFGVATYHAFGDIDGSASRLARWAAGGPYPDYSDRTVELSAIPLFWMLGTSNRPQRDWVTKALVQLLHGHLPVMSALLDRFWAVNDPYIVQRTVVIAHGCVLRGGSADPTGGAELAKIVRELVFTRPMRPDELMLDAARGVVRWAAGQGHLPEDALAATRRPYGFPKPGSPPRLDKLEAEYRYRETNVSDSESYLSLFVSVFGLGDFGRYVIEPAAHRFTTHPVDKPRPQPPERREESTLNKAAWKRFWKSLTPEQQTAFEGDLDPADLVRLMYGDGDPALGLTREHLELFRASWRRPTRTHRDDTFPVERAQRWVFARALKFGWSPQLFGHVDRYLGHDYGRSEHKPERWGKKYQWMAFHELLARLADNYHPSERYGQSEQFDGLFEMVGEREIDPSLPPTPFLRFAERESADTWPPVPIRFPNLPADRLDLSAYGGDVARFVADVETEPLAAAIVQTTDGDGRRWFVIEGVSTQADGDGDARGRALEQTTFIHGWFVAASDAERFAAMTLGRVDRLPDPLGDTHGHTDCCLAGEVGWDNPTCYHQQADLIEAPDGNTTIRAARAAETYTWEGNILDCSIDETVRAEMPSAYVRRVGHLRWDGTTLTWRDDHGRVAAAALGAEDGDWRHLLFEEAWLLETLEANDLALVVATSYQRRLMDKERTYRHPHIDGETAAIVRSSGEVVALPSKRDPSGGWTD